MKKIIINNFIESFNELAKEVSEIEEANGWDMKDDLPNQAMKIALMHSELSEALEALRHENPFDDHIPEFRGTEAEFADVIIRIMHMAYRLNYNVAGAVIAKINYNKGREYKHGGKKFG